ncbi:MAG: alpha/beta fold hydrolase [Clostridia bacterium]|nr:alpha/beta fold hydrolase [Clostridia bacterium]
MIFEKQILKMYRGMAFTRCDDNGTAYYFSADDFAGLKKEALRFQSSRGHELAGYVYSYENPAEGRLIVFDHGFGGGHRSYMKEIEMLCRHGYRVFAYDHTGCMESGGENPNGMAQSLCDLNDCITMLKNDARFGKMKLSVIGHSWGGFSVLNIAALHPEITHVVVLSGFVSVQLLINSYFSGIMKGYRKAVMALEKQANPEFVRYHAADSLLKSDAQVLLIYSDNDKMCHKAVHYDALLSALKDRKNTAFVLEKNKGHNPNYTEDAVRYLGEYVSAKTKLMKKSPAEAEKAAFVQSWDWNRMTAQDEAVWEKIFNCLDNGQSK